MVIENWTFGQVNSYEIDVYHLKHYKNLKDALKRPNEVYVLEISPFNDVKLKALIAGNKSEQLKAYYEQITKLKYLRELRLSNCQLTVIPESVNKCKYLETISIHVNEGLNWDSTFSILAGVNGWDFRTG